MKRILIVAGGTGGHIFPALVVARALRAKGVTVCWLGTREGLEGRLVAKEFPLTYIAIKAFRGKGLLRKLWIPIRLLWATGCAYRIMRRLKPDVVFGMGSYVAAPAGLAAWLARIPLVIHEQNSVAGLTNRLLAKIATVVLQAFPRTFPLHMNVMMVGNPVRPDLVAAPSPTVRLADRQGPLRLLVLGGSQGARVVNQQVLAALADYPEKHELIVWHQTGQLDFSVVEERYKTIAIEAKVNAFIDGMATAYCWADLIVCRAGALTVSEIATVGVASILIPYPYAVDDHQFHNSRYLEQAGAGIIITQKFLTKRRLIKLFEQFAHDRDRLLTMAECARHLAQPQAVDDVITECEKVSE